MTVRLSRIWLLTAPTVVVRLAVAATLVIGLVSCARSGGGPQRPDGNAPDRMALVWSTEVVKPQHGGGGSVAISDDVIAVADGLDVQLLNPTTGRSQKRLSGMDGEEVTGVWVSGAVVVVRTGRSEDGHGRSVLYGFEHATGKRLWSTGRLLNGTGPPTVEVFSNTVILREGDRQGLTALAADTGKVLWSGQVPDICPHPVADPIGMRYAMDVVQVGDVLAALARCNDRAEIFGIGLADATIRWRKPLGELTDRSCIKADGTVALVAFDDRFSLFDMSGETLLARSATGAASCAIQSTDRGVAISRDSVVELIEPKGGQSYWQQRNPNSVDDQFQVLAGGRLYSRAAEKDFLPSFVSSTDLSTGDTKVLPLPIRAELIGAAGDLLIYKIYLTWSIRYAAVRPEFSQLANPVLAGAAPNDWPDACSLLSAADLDSLGGFTAFPEAKQTQLYGVGIPRPTRCNYLSAKSDDAFSVTVSWVSSDRVTLAALLESGALEGEAYSAYSGALEKIGRHAFLIPKTPFLTSEAFLVRGSHALFVGVPSDVEGPLAREVVKLLLASAPDLGQEPAVPFDISAAHLVVRSLGYEPNSVAVQLGPLRVITAICATSATAHCQQIFFFHDQDFVGVGSGEDAEHGATYRWVKILDQDGQIVRMEFAVYGPSDANCCPSARQAQNYRYQGNLLEYQNDSGPWRPAPKAPKPR